MNLEKIMESVEFVKNKVKNTPKIGIILGSGLGDLAEEIEEKVCVKYEDIPNMPKSTVAGHAGQFVFGKLEGKDVVMMQGRIHFYEGHPMEILALPIHIMKYMGVEKLIVTNAAGGVNKEFNPGDLMVITDHINFAFTNPLIGKNDEKIGPRFPDVSNAYDKDLVELTESIGNKLNINLKKGVYVMMTGPTYETPAEVRMVRILGGDAVGMSTVPDILVAKHCGLKTLGISCITNMAAGILDQPLCHSEVIETSNRVKSTFTSLVREIIKSI
ncbi:purine-nucleoside phosphorylase [uncultured Clostridium sp.]|uniref:purine-nucleoside phosphorylase n=1 Tax=uncultured Clostridium sp. TaxID=59620 RepID=UPI0028EA6217|nr:purine-nucleoside phosphorylase [uncultured Clostridium sp.]